MNGLWMYTLKQRYERRILEFKSDGTIGMGKASCERRWRMSEGKLIISGDQGDTLEAKKSSETTYVGHWTRNQQVDVLLSKQEDTSDFEYNIVNLHCHDINVGDQFSTPSKYYKKLGYTDSVNHHPILKDEICVIGGGGLMHESFQVMLKKRMDVMANRCIFWGVGSNNHSIMNSYFHDYLSKAALVGVRDYVGDYRWVPCASCKHPVFDICINVKPKYDYVYLLHSSAKKELPGWVDKSKHVIYNDTEDIVHICMQLSLGDTIVTNTYHGAYWSTLMGKKVIVVPFSNRFLRMKHEPLIVDKTASIKDVSKLTRAYPKALQECREANDSFYTDVMEKIKKLA